MCCNNTRIWWDKAGKNLFSNIHTLTVKRWHPGAPQSNHSLLEELMGQKVSYSGVLTKQLSTQWSHCVGVICRPLKWPVIRMLGVVQTLINVLPCRWNDCFQCGVVPLLPATEHTYTSIYIFKKTVIRGFSISFAIVLSLCEFGSGLKSFILPHGPRWGGLQHRQNKRSADKQRHKEACQLKPVAFILPERKLFGKVLITVLLLCHFTETKKRLLNALQKR